MLSAFSLRSTLLGLALWVVPFVAAACFFNEKRELTIPLPLFKSIMVVLSGTVGMWLVIVAFRRVPPTRANGILMGTYWMLINLALDYLVLLPLSGQDVTSYYQDIGLKYAMMPITGGFVAKAIQEHAHAKKN
jgi:hypothetical protein